MERRIFLPFILLLITAKTFCQSEVIEKTKVYKNIDGIALTADLFYTSESKEKGNCPAIAFFHGGGWAYGSPSEFYNACRRYAEMGFVTASFSYRLSITEEGKVPHPDITPVECVKDARSALRWLKMHAEELGIDPKKIVASGQSAGGQLALCTALCDEINESTDDLTVDPTPAAFLLYSSNVNTLEAWCDRLMGDRREDIWSISPYHKLKPGMPPAIEFHGTEDPMVPFWVAEHFMFEARKLGNHFEQIKFSGKQHYLAEDNEKYATYFDEAILERSDRFLREQGLMPE